MRRAHERVIETWILTIITDGGIQRFDDLHVDVINKKWNSPRLWIQGGIEAFEVAIRLRDFHRIPYTLVLAIRLQEGDRLLGIDFKTREDVAARQGFTPPSLYLFVPGEEPWVRLGPRNSRRP